MLSTLQPLNALPQIFRGESILESTSPLQSFRLLGLYMQSLSEMGGFTRLANCDICGSASDKFHKRRMHAAQPDHRCGGHSARRK
jgi:hypothetical protein